MKEVIQVTLENEMDLILGHKRSMKLAELCGLSHTIQTTFATAVSEISRGVMGKNRKALLILSIGNTTGNRKEIVATVQFDGQKISAIQSAIKYAQRLVYDVRVSKDSAVPSIILKQGLNFSGLLNDVRITGFINYFNNELPLSPYEELRKKNIQLIDLAEKLKESEDQYKILTDNLPLMLFTTNAGGFITFCNRRLKEYFSTECDNGKTSWLQLVSRHDNSEIRSEWQTAQETVTVMRKQARLTSKSETSAPAWHMISVVPVKTETGQLTGWTGFFIDIQAQKMVDETLKNNRELTNAQKQLLQSQIKLEEKIVELNKSNHDLEQFAYIASHDLQEPLRKIRSFAELLKSNLQDADKTDKYLRKIDESSSRMSNLIKDVLDYSRLTKSTSVFEQVALKDIISSVKIDMELLIEEKKASLELGDLPVINGIRQQLYQLFYNLVSNALKFTSTRPVVSISAEPLTEQKRTESNIQSKSPHVVITVKDNGIGFDSKYSQQIFTIFKRLNNRDSYSGTGIGLALCKKIVDNHHGMIEAESAPGEGATFRIVLPVE